MALHSAESVSSEHPDNGEWTSDWTLGITLVCFAKTDPYVRNRNRGTRGTGNRAAGSWLLADGQPILPVPALGRAGLARHRNDDRAGSRVCVGRVL